MLTQVDAAANSSVVTGEIIIHEIIAHALIDLGATHSFISSKYVRKLGRTAYQVSVLYSVTLPSRVVLQSTLILRACLIIIEGRELYVDLIMLDMSNYEVILGMDWLTKYNAFIGCRRKLVIFKPSEEFNHIGL